jgi:hypothetical protein
MRQIVAVGKNPQGNIALFVEQKGAIIYNNGE